MSDEIIIPCYVNENHKIVNRANTDLFEKLFKVEDVLRNLYFRISKN